MTPVLVSELACVVVVRLVVPTIFASNFPLTSDPGALMAKLFSNFFIAIENLEEVNVRSVVADHRLKENRGWITFFQVKFIRVPAVQRQSQVDNLFCKSPLVLTVVSPHEVVPILVFVDCRLNRNLFI